MLRDSGSEEKGELQTAPSSRFLAVNPVPSLSPLWTCGNPRLGPAAVLSQAGSSSALITVMDLFSASKMMQFYLFIFLSCMLRPSVFGVYNGCSTVSQQYHLCQLLLQYLAVCINQSFSWAFLICVECRTCSNSGIWHPVHMLSTFQDLLTASQKGSKIGFFSTFPSQLNSAEMYEGGRRKDRALATSILRYW